MKIQWSPLAVERIGEISDYIAQESPNAAERWALITGDEMTDI